MPDKRRVIWSRESSRQVQSIKKYLLDEWGEDEANNFLNKLKKFENLVAHFPKLYPASLKHSKLRKAVVTKHQSVVYEIDGEVIRVHTALNHYKQN